ncbi:MAG TPA: YqaJ viral recombinase family protein [Syntrophorhabdaceae bacterium]|jgi:putative phage-type endonuclease
MNRDETIRGNCPAVEEIAMDAAAVNVVECAHCGQILQVPAGLTASTITCPECASRWIQFPYKILDFVQGTAAWHDWRNQGLGASDAPVIMGENPWKKPEWLLKAKLGGLSFGSNEAMRRGNELEPEARESYERVRGIKVRPVCLVSTRYEWLRTSLDGLAHDGSTVIEIKCGKSTYRHAASKRQVPPYYQGQLQHILAVTGLDEIDFWCYMPDRPEVHLCIKRDDPYIERLIEAEEKFWQELKRRRELQGDPEQSESQV